MKKTGIKMRHRLLTGILIFIGMFLFSCSDNPPLDTVKQVDLQRYSGLWYEIAAFPQRFQRGCTCTTARYTVKDGFVQVLNRCFRKDKGKWTSIEGKAFVTDESTNSKLKVQFFWPLRGKYWIIDLAEDYSYAVVGHPNRDYLWVLSREPEMNEDLYQDIISKVEEKGFDASRLQRTEHNCDEYPKRNG